MNCTSSEAAKLLRKLNEERSTILSDEHRSSTFVVASGEDVESLRPDYSYIETSRRLEEIEEKIVTIKHALNLFNSQNKLPGMDITVDEALIIIPQLTQRKSRLDTLRSRLPKTREMSQRGSIIDYTYTNYDPKEAQEDYEEVSDMLSAIQTALDLLNSTKTLEINI